MQLLPRVILAVAVVGSSGYATPSAEANDRAAVLVCDVSHPDGPRARVLDVGGSGELSGIRGIGGFDDLEDIRDRSCAEILAALADDGFAFEEFLEIERDVVAIFALDRND
jgi:hypothetical protein